MGEEAHLVTKHSLILSDFWFYYSISYIHAYRTDMSNDFETLLSDTVSIRMLAIVMLDVPDDYSPSLCFIRVSKNLQH